jgi:hypothetical protein
MNERKIMMPMIDRGTIPSLESFIGISLENPVRLKARIAVTSLRYITRRI